MENCGSLNHIFTNYAEEGNQTYAMFCDGDAKGNKIRVSLTSKVLSFAEIRMFKDNPLKYSWEDFGGSGEGQTTYELESTLGIGSRIWLVFTWTGEESGDRWFRLRSDNEDTWAILHWRLVHNYTDGGITNEMRFNKVCQDFLSILILKLGTKINPIS